MISAMINKQARYENIRCQLIAYIILNSTNLREWLTTRQWVCHHCMKTSVPITLRLKVIQRMTVKMNILSLLMKVSWCKVISRFGTIHAWFHHELCDSEVVTGMSVLARVTAKFRQRNCATVYR